MKSFDDFLSSISVDDVTKVMLSVEPEVPKEHFKENEIALVEKIISITSIQNREMLRLYHEWMGKQQ